MKIIKSLLGCKVTFLFVLSFLVVTINSVNAQTLHPLGVKLLQESEYEQLPKVNWGVMKSNANSRTILRSGNGVVMLNNPPVGDQDMQGSCVGWAVGYAATGILAYSKFNNWSDARRSPNYVYNQIKMSNDCLSGTTTKAGLDLAKSQGVCSYILMPYVINDCMTLPNNAQKLDASYNTVLSWSTLSRNDASGIKQALDLGYPVVVAFQVYTSFDNMWYSGGIWDTNTGTSRGSHATCIIGYDDTKQMFKVQNSWGTSGGDNGCFWVTYNLVQNNCFNEVYVVSEINQYVPAPIISGPSFVCPGENAAFSVLNLPQDATIEWDQSSGVIRLSSQGSNPCTFFCSEYGDGYISAKIAAGSFTTTLYASVVVGKIINQTDFSLDVYDIATGHIISQFGPEVVYKNKPFEVVARNNNDKQVSNYVWSVPFYWNIVSTNDNSAIIDPGINTEGDVTVYGTNSCGVEEFLTEMYLLTAPIGYIWYSISLIPNPASTEINIEMVDNTDSQPTTATIDPTYTVSIVDATTGIPVYKGKKKGKKFNLSTAALHNGVYNVIVSDGVNTYQKKLIVKH